MKSRLALLVVLALCGCQNVRSGRDNPALKSEREYAESSEARAQGLVRTGQASSLGAARARAADEANAEWAAAAKSSESKARQAAFEKELADSIGARK